MEGKGVRACVCVERRGCCEGNKGRESEEIERARSE